MSKQAFIRIYESWTEETAHLTHEEKGRLMDALILYSRTGEEKQPEGNERFVYPSLVLRIKRERETHEQKQQRRKENPLPL